MNLINDIKLENRPDAYQHMISAFKRYSERASIVLCYRVWSENEIQDSEVYVDGSVHLNTLRKLAHDLERYKPQGGAA